MTRYTPLWLQSGSYAASVDRRLPGALWPTPRVDGMAVTLASGTTVNIAPGNAAVPTPNNTGSTLCVSDAVEQVVLPVAPAAGLNRTDKVIVRPRGTDLDGGVNNDFIFDYVSGGEAASAWPMPPDPPGCLTLAAIDRVGGEAAITPAYIYDYRPGSLTAASAFAPVAFRVRNAAQSIPRAVWTDITTYGAVDENVGGGTWAGGVYTIPATGRYILSGAIHWSVTSNAAPYAMQCQWSITSGASGGAGDFLGLVPIPASYTANQVNALPTTVRMLNKGDKWKVQGYNGHPSAALSTFANYTGIECVRIA